MNKSVLIISLLLLAFNVSNANAFFWDNTDYSAVEKAFKSDKPIQFFEYKNNNFNSFCNKKATISVKKELKKS